MSWMPAVGGSLRKTPTARKKYYQAKLDTARFYFKRVLPETAGLFATMTAGAETLMAMDEAAF